MATSNPQTFVEMSRGDVESIGAHCQLEYCHVLDFLPFRCESCKGTYCLEHRSETAHKCPDAGLWARKRAEQNGTSASLPSRPRVYNHESQCGDLSCKTLINTSRMPANECSSCNRSYCLSHRMPESHDCKNVPRRGALPTSARQQTLSALSKLKLWAETKRKEDAKRLTSVTKKTGIFGLGKSSKSSAAATVQAEIAALKRAAKGESSIPADKRVYLVVEASADTTKFKYPSGKFYYNSDWTVGRVLDMAAKSLQVQNVNNRGGGEEEKLRVFHVEGGKLLKFSEKLGAHCKTGDMIVLLRGVGSGEPDLIDL